MLLHLPGMSLLLKPPGWEVDTEGAHSGVRHLSAFLQGALPLGRRAIALRPAFAYGFMHRLDAPSSGLILTATTFLGHCFLKWQMETYTIAREYYVVGRGLPKAVELDVAQRILDMKMATVAKTGRPAQSNIKFLAAMGRGIVGSGGLEGISPVSIRIFTGRRHQIRVHMQFCDCASAADLHYGVERIVLRVPSCLRAAAGYQGGIAPIQDGRLLLRRSAREEALLTAAFQATPK